MKVVVTTVEVFVSLVVVFEKFSVMLRILGK